MYTSREQDTQCSDFAMKRGMLLFSKKYFRNVSWTRFVGESREYACTDDLFLSRSEQKQRRDKYEITEKEGRKRRAAGGMDGKNEAKLYRKIITG